MFNSNIIIYSFFVGIFVFILILERFFSAKISKLNRLTRWYSNLSIAIINNVIVSFLIPISVISLAMFASENKIGILNNIDLPYYISVILSIIILDLIIYWQHRLFHFIPILWRLHRMHHTDLDFDVTTGIRFHPIEIVLSTIIKGVVVMILGVPVLSVFIFQMILTCTSMFTHGNVQLPQKVDKILRLVIVTPNMHRIHHSVISDETNSNFGFNISVWDKLFSTYKDQSKDKEIKIGLNIFRKKEDLHLHKLLIQPFYKDNI